MPASKKKSSKKKAASGHVIGRGRFAKISAVEGIEMKPAMHKRAATSAAKKMSHAETRELIMRAYRKG